MSNRRLILNWGIHVTSGAPVEPQCRHVGRQIFTCFRPNLQSFGAAPPIRQTIKTETGGHMSLFAAAVVVSVLFVASYSQRSTWLALFSMPMSMALVFGCLFLSTVHDHGQVRIWFAWAAR